MTLDWLHDQNEELIKKIKCSFCMCLRIPSNLVCGETICMEEMRVVPFAKKNPVPRPSYLPRSLRDLGHLEVYSRNWYFLLS